MAKNTKCSCPIGTVKGDCPFSYANGWHLMRAAILLQSDLPKAEKLISKMSAKAHKKAREHNDYFLDDGSDDET